MFACGGQLTAGAGIALEGIACSVYTAGSVFAATIIAGFGGACCALSTACFLLSRNAANQEAEESKPIARNYPS